MDENGEFLKAFAPSSPRNCSSSARAQRGVQHEATRAQVFNVLVIVFELGLKQQSFVRDSKCFGFGVEV